MHSRTIAARLEALYPEPSLHLDSPILQKVYTIQSKHGGALWPLWMPLVSERLLSPRSKEYFDRTREEDEDVRMPLPLFLKQSEEREEEMWEVAKPALRDLGALLEETPEGPFFMGAVGEFVSCHFGGK